MSQRPKQVFQPIKSLDDAFLAARAQGATEEVVFIKSRIERLAKEFLSVPVDPAS